MSLPRNLIFTSSRKAAGWILIALAAFHLTASVVGRKYHPQPAPAPPAYKEVGDWKPAQPKFARPEHPSRGSVLPQARPGVYRSHVVVRSRHPAQDVAGCGRLVPEDF